LTQIYVLKNIWLYRFTRALPTNMGALKYHVIMLYWYCDSGFYFAVTNLRDLILSYLFPRISRHFFQAHARHNSSHLRQNDVVPVTTEDNGLATCNRHWRQTIYLHIYCYRCLVSRDEFIIYSHDT